MQELLAADIGQPAERIVRDINRDFWMSAHDALAYGIIDTVIGQTLNMLAVDRVEPGTPDGHAPASSHTK
jgi:ATP-dependent protease ClpP protease subunit